MSRLNQFLIGVLLVMAIAFVGINVVSSFNNTAKIANADDSTTSPAPTADSAIPTPMVVSCPSLNEMRSSTNVDWTRIGSEPCAYGFNTSDGSFKSFTIPSNTIYNIATQDGKVHVGNGHNQVASAKAATLRPQVGNPGLTSMKQLDLIRPYAAPAGYDAQIIVCDDCSGVSPAPAADSGCPTVNGVVTTPIDGGCLWKVSNPSDLTVPNGWQALSGIPAKMYPAGTVLHGITQASLYPK